MNYRKIFQDEVSRRLAVQSVPELLQESDLVNLPAPVQKYLHYTGLWENLRSAIFVWFSAAG
ncbi:MAG TPA: hypothetical protein PKG48_15160 [Bacteroidales bacterium]|nr:hypothetical protein [Bacteroidales bacterium]